MRGGRPGGGEGCGGGALGTPRGSEARGGRPGQDGTHLPKEGGAGVRRCLGRGSAELVRGRGGGAGVGRYRLPRGRAAGPAGGPSAAGRGLCAGRPRAPRPPTPRLLQTARCTPAWSRWPRSRRSSSAAQSRMTRYCPQHPPPVGGGGPGARARPQPFLTAPHAPLQFGSGMLDVGMDVSPPEPPWDPLPLFPGRRPCHSTLSGLLFSVLTPDTPPPCPPALPSGGPSPRVRGHCGLLGLRLLVIAYPLFLQTFR